MGIKGSEEIKKRQNTLFASMLLSLGAPLATGMAVMMNRSLTQVADFIRRTMEFVVLLLSWSVFRYLNQGPERTEVTKRKLERTVNLGVAGALGLSGLIMLSLAISGFGDSRTGGTIWLGLTIAILGFLVNFWFFRRYSLLSRDNADSIIDAQRRLYLAKLLVDICVIVALGSVALLPTQAISIYVDTVGSTIVALYLLWSAWRTWNDEQNVERSTIT